MRRLQVVDSLGQRVHHRERLRSQSVSFAFSPDSATEVGSSPGTGNVNTPLLGRTYTRDTMMSGLPTQEELDRAYCYPNPTLMPHFGRRHATLIAISGAIGTGLFLGSGTPLYDAGPLGLLLGYLCMSSVVYGMVVSSAEMVAVYPYCRGTVGLADRFVDPALGFAMGWNAWYHWGIIIPSQIAAATALLKYWNPPGRLAALWPPVFIILTSASVFGARIYGEIESVFSLIKISAVIFMVIMSIVFAGEGGTGGRGVFEYWSPPFSQYLGIEGSWGRLLGFFSVFIQASVSFFGTEIPSLIAGEVVDAPRVIRDVSLRVWLRVSVLYLLGVFVAGTLVDRKLMQSHSIDWDSSKPEDDAPWSYSPFLTALRSAGAKYSWVANLSVAAFVSSAASAASTEVFISSRYLYFLAKAGHAPQLFGKVWPNTHEARARGAVVPYVGVATTVGFATMAFLAMRPGENTMSNMEKIFKAVNSMTNAACLQAWVGTLFTYIRFYWGTKDPQNVRDYPSEIKRIKENRAWGQPFWAIYSFCVCSFVLVFNGWSLFNQRNGKWVIYYDPKTQGAFPRDQVLKFITTYLPIPTFLVLLFGYKLICQTTMRSTKQMNFSGVAFVDKDMPPVEERPDTLWGRVWWVLVK